LKNEASLAFVTIEELAGLLAKRKISPVELTELFLRRIERQNPALNAFLTVTAEHALAAAHRVEKQLLRRRSSRRENFPLLGIPITLKDNIWTRGIRSTAGSKILRDFIPSEDSTVARKLAQAGAILIGKTNLNEFAYGITGGNAHYGPVHNPWALDRISGGSIPPPQGSYSSIWAPEFCLRFRRASRQQRSDGSRIWVSKYGSGTAWIKSTLTASWWRESALRAKPLSGRRELHHPPRASG